MQAGRIEPSLAWHGFIVLRMFRRWTAARDSQLPPLPTLVELAAELEQPFHVAVALDSVFHLTEACLGRQLVAECCCSRELAADERAILRLLAVAALPASPKAPPSIPHGLPGTLCWAVAAARAGLGTITDSVTVPSARDRCPFSQERIDKCDLSVAYPKFYDNSSQ